jgi:hypothetical protein
MLIQNLKQVYYIHGFEGGCGYVVGHVLVRIIGDRRSYKGNWCNCSW